MLRKCGNQPILHMILEGRPQRSRILETTDEHFIYHEQILKPEETPKEQQFGLLRALQVQEIFFYKINNKYIFVQNQFMISHPSSAALRCDVEERILNPLLPHLLATSCQEPQ